MEKQHTQAEKNSSSPKGQPSFFESNEIFKEQWELRGDLPLFPVHKSILLVLLKVFLYEEKKPQPTKISESTTHKTITSLFPYSL